MQAGSRGFPTLFEPRREGGNTVMGSFVTQLQELRKLLDSMHIYFGGLLIDLLAFIILFEIDHNLNLI